jgi:pimeloyl-ACP methyl ester carboxylesterase
MMIPRSCWPIRLASLAGCAIVITACASSPSARPAPASSAPVGDPSAARSSTPDGPEALLFAVEVGGLAIQGHCSGDRPENAPVVILQAGNGGSDTHLAGIETHLVARTQVCAFARPGAGGSDAPASLPRTVDTVVAEIHEVLTVARIEPPYFLVGQSAGAAISFMFAQAYPDEVAGFVFMNGNPPYETWVAEAPGLGIPQGMVDGAVADFSGINPEQIDFRSNESMLATPLPAEDARQQRSRSELRGNSRTRMTGDFR